MDRLLNATEEEQRFLRILFHYWRANQYQGTQWVSLIPVFNNGEKGHPIPVPPVVSKPMPITEIPIPFDDEETVREDAPPSPTPRVSDNGVSLDLDLGTTCREAIRAILMVEKRRMTSGEIYQWLEDHAKSYTKSTVIKTLTLMQDNGEIDNDKDDCGKGYGLRAWAKRNGVIDT